MTGDLEEAGIEDLLETYKNSNVLDADIYEVGHHGSHNGSTEELLEAITPTRAVISMGLWSFGCGSRNRFTTYAYGHPRRITVEMLAHNVTKTRPAKIVKVADRARRFSDYRTQKAIYGTGWDGTIVMIGKLNGQLRVILNN
jgi:competence protein ComEC